MSRTQISKKVRFDVFKRDNFKCQYCGGTPDESVLEVDHIHPVCEGGTNAIDNLLTACFSCNRGKGGEALSAIPKSLAQKADEMIERELQLARYREIVRLKDERIEDEMWEIAEALLPGSSAAGMRNEWLRSIRMFTGRMPVYLAVECAQSAHLRGLRGRSLFLYFCAACWNRIREAE